MTSRPCKSSKNKPVSRWLRVQYYGASQYTCNPVAHGTGSTFQGGQLLFTQTCIPGIQSAVAARPDGYSVLKLRDIIDGVKLAVQIYTFRARGIWVKALRKK